MEGEGTVVGIRVVRRKLDKNKGPTGCWRFEKKYRRKIELGDGVGGDGAVCRVSGRDAVVGLFVSS